MNDNPYEADLDIDEETGEVTLPPGYTGRGSRPYGMRERLGQTYSDGGGGGPWTGKPEIPRIAVSKNRTGATIPRPTNITARTNRAATIPGPTRSNNCPPCPPCPPQQVRTEYIETGGECPPQRECPPPPPSQVRTEYIEVPGECPTAPPCPTRRCSTDSLWGLVAGMGIIGGVLWYSGKMLTEVSEYSEEDLDAVLASLPSAAPSLAAPEEDDDSELDDASGAEG